MGVFAMIAEFRTAVLAGLAGAVLTVAGVPQDLEEARRWYKKAADQGDADSKAALDRLGP
jgi:TPR repeat protein